VITGATRVAAVIGWPVGHSLSPALHNAAFAASDADWVYVALPVEPGRAVDALDAMATLGIAGLSVTMPHKADVAAAVDSVSPAAQALRSVNTVVRQADGALVGHSTDGAGFVASLRADAGFDPRGRSVVVLGAGAASRSVIDALATAGVGRIAVVNRTAATAEEAAALAPDVASVCPTSELSAVVRAADLVVNATSIGMGSSDVPLDTDLLRPGQLVAELVYHPLETALLAAARARGCDVLDGLGMLVHQAAIQQELWTGSSPDVAVMRAAALAELDRRAGVGR
jgi:shikimate dehydrogenase